MRRVQATEKEHKGHRAQARMSRAGMAALAEVVHLATSLFARRGSISAASDGLGPEKRLARYGSGSGSARGDHRADY
jgi:hypothetical protein